MATLALGNAVHAGKKTTLTVDYLFKGIEKGYDHNSIGKLFVDGTLVYETGEHLESKPQSFKVNIKPGKRHIRLELWAQYEGVWELHSMDNNYSVDCIVDETFDLRPGNRTLKVVFDLDSNTTYSLK